MNIIDKLIPEKPAQLSKVQEFLLQYGQHHVYRTESGRKIIVLPTCSASVEQLNEENWDQRSRENDDGFFRVVRHITQLVNGEKVHLYAKGPEYIFTAEQRLLQKGEFWWGGQKSGEKRIRLYTDTVKEQVEWEAVFLLELHRYGICAELPQALIEDSNGSKKLIVKGIKEYNPYSLNAKPIPNQPSIDEICTIIETKIGLEPVDYGNQNILRDEDGYNVIIDVNRWTWPPHTDDFRRRLLKEILSNL